MKFGINVFFTVPCGISFAVIKTEVCAEVDKKFACFIASERDLLRKTVGKRCEDNVAFFNSFLFGNEELLADISVCGVKIGNALTGIGNGAESCKSRIRMTEKDPYEFRAGITGSADD